MSQYKVGDVTGVKTRSGIQDVVIKSMRRVSKGRNAGKLMTVGDVRKIVREELGQGEMCQGSWKDADIDRINDEMDAEEDALNYDPSGRWSSEPGLQFNPGSRVYVDDMGREGTVVSMHAMGDMADVDFGNGDVYGVTLRRMKPVGESVMMTVGNVRNMVKKALNERLEVGDYVIVKQRGM